MRIAMNAIPVRPGGGLTVLLGLLEGLQNLRADSEFVVFCSASDTARMLRAAKVNAEIVIAVPNAATSRRYLWQHWRLGRELDARNVDVLLTFNHFLRNVRCKQVVYHLNVRRFSKEFRDNRFSSWLRESLRDRASRDALVHADSNVFESEFLRAIADATIDGTVNAGEVIYIGLPNDMVDTLTVPTTLDDARIVSITSPHPHKDNETMIRTIANLVRDRPTVPWRLDVAGGHHPSVWRPFRQIADDLKVSDRIRWLGFCDREELNQLLDQSLCLLATSVMESFAMVPLEGMARGCPPVAANTSSMPESVGEAGILVSPHQPVEFAAAILRLHDDPALRRHYADLGRQRVQSFRWSTCGQQFSHLIDRLCA